MADMTMTKAPLGTLPTSFSGSVDDLRIVDDLVVCQCCSFLSIGGLVKQLLACRRNLKTVLN